MGCGQSFISRQEGVELLRYIPLIQSHSLHIFPSAKGHRRRQTAAKLTCGRRPIQVNRFFNGHVQTAPGFLLASV